MMTQWKTFEERISEHVQLARRPVAVTFLDAPPQGVERFSGTEPSSCSFWRLAAEGRTFYTVPSDHFNCAVGGYTMRIELPEDRAVETEQTLAMMFGAGYLRPAEVSGIVRLPQAPAAILYSPLGDAPQAPGVVLFAARPVSAMLIQEAAIRAGKAASLPPLGRPTCMALPAALASGTVTSLGCIGNRAYTGLGDDELYVAVRGVDLPAIAEALDVIASANTQINTYAVGRRGQLATE